ncbi:MAG: hypothetical protein CSB55_02220 [Candidatus Cloacimonadota bacterium]|nr:MAG: hypothetical protein CSB55_02220 [Candidatus Cloacimonadota bacterium]
MKKIIITISIACLIFALSAEKKFYDVNGLRKLSPEELQELRERPQFNATMFRNERELPEALNNANTPFFPPVIQQEGGSCGQASGVYYQFGYEMNRLRGANADVQGNQYPTHFTWNFLNGGAGMGSYPFDGWTIIDKVGCPDITTYGGHFAEGGNTRWMSGYDNYRAGMTNRIKNHLNIDVSDEDGLHNLKQWMTDKGIGDETGGIANFAAGVSPISMDYIPDGEYAGKSIITEWSHEPNHAMTFVGFDDNVCYDINGDGQFTNDIDINNDGEVNLKDWERGALIVANSWGSGWEDNGFSYMMYRLLAIPCEEGGIWENMVFVLNGRADYEPKLGLKVTMNHNCRKKIRLAAGISQDPDAELPDWQIDFPIVNFQGGDHGMNGYGNEIELGIDITDFAGIVSETGAAKIFLAVQENDPDNSSYGEITGFSIINYQNNDEETICPQTNIPIENNGVTSLSVPVSLTDGNIEIIGDSNIYINHDEEFETQFNAVNGTEPYVWNMLKKYNETETDIDEELEIDETWTFINTNTTDDDFAYSDLPFTFNFYGKNYDRVGVLTDGSLVFDVDHFVGLRSLSNLKKYKAITPFGRDLQSFPEYGEGIFSKATEDEITFQWNTSEYNNPGKNFRFAVVLTRENEIKFIFGNNLSEPGNFVSGISDGSGLNYEISSANYYNNIPDNYALTFTSDSDYENVNLTEDGFFSGTKENNAYVSEYKILVTDYDHTSAMKTIRVLSGVENETVPYFEELKVINCYPNPLISQRSETTISFEINKPQTVNLNIYNIKGQKVSSVNKKCKTGFNKLSWKGINSNGKYVTEGVYFYKISTEKNEKYGKILLLK